MKLKRQFSPPHFFIYYKFLLLVNHTSAEQNPLKFNKSKIKSTNYFNTLPYKLVLWSKLIVHQFFLKCRFKSIGKC